MTREEVGVNVGLDDPLDPQAVLGRVLQIDRHVAVRVRFRRASKEKYGGAMGWPSVTTATNSSSLIGARA